MLKPPESSSALLVSISGKSVSICNHFHARVVDKFDAPYGGLLEPRRSKRKLLKSTFNAKYSYAGCLDLSPVMSAQFSLEMYVTG